MVCQSLHRPLAAAPTNGVRNVGTGVNPRSIQSDSIVWTILKIGVHDADRVAAHMQQPGRNRRLVAEVSRQDHAANPWVTGRQRTNGRRGAVAATVVYDQDLEIDARGFEGCRDLGDEGGEVFLLVERGHDDAQLGDAAPTADHTASNGA